MILLPWRPSFYKNGAGDVCREGDGRRDVGHGKLETGNGSFGSEGFGASARRRVGEWVSGRTVVLNDKRM